MYAILLHMMPATKESWEAFAEKLQTAGYTTIAIDERGHGESTQAGSLLYTSMPDEQQRAKKLDVEAAFDYVRRTYDAKSDQIVLIGASIGANLAIQCLVEHEAIPLAVALSPGLNYRGIKTEPFVKHLSDDQKLLLVASDEDEHSFKAIHALHNIAPDKTVLIEKHGIGHGTTMTDKEPGLIDRIIDELP